VPWWTAQVVDREALVDRGAVGAAVVERGAVGVAVVERGDLMNSLAVLALSCGPRLCGGVVESLVWCLWNVLVC